ncbi:cellulose biosynthesis protein BcsG [uncultured Sutterella sp.]|uniref:cellulose biosynthesis protein BcsG n=1 Tax=uncultured Sutterella sp. TaxID=286133 RepID=UPI00266F3180|nr:cellulose biosynthesis protein BcsG [uncultured Sutterella sp.]
MQTRIENGAGPRFTGLGVWNVYFIIAFALAAFGYIELNLLGNALLMAWLLLPVGPKWLRILRGTLGVAAAAVLLYSESWLPGVDSILANKGGIAGFSLLYMAEFALDFINVKMVGWGLLVFLGYFLVRRYVRVTFFTIVYFLGAVTMPWVQSILPERAPVVTADAGGQTNEAAAPAKTGKADAKAVGEWYDAFLAYEHDRRARFPNDLSEKDTPFDILLLSICSVSNDDLAVSQLDQHPLFKEFNIRFDSFNAATAYSGPALLRLLNGACGQPSHSELYGERRPECEIMTRLGTLGYSQRLLMDHSGEYDNFLQSMRDKAGVTATLDNAKYPTRYMGFDDEEIADSLAVLRHWQRTQVKSKAGRTATLINFIALHDGNRLPGRGRAEPFKPRAQEMFDNIRTFLRELERSGRKTMVVIVPEHGAAVRGDKIQVPRLRDIPTMRISRVPVMVKFVGLKGMPNEPIHVTGNTSYLALTSLIGKTLETDYFSKDGGTVPLEQLVHDLPQTNPVSENGTVQTLEYQGREYFRQNGGEWKPYGG